MQAAFSAPLHSTVACLHGERWNSPGPDAGIRAGRIIRFLGPRTFVKAEGYDCSQSLTLQQDGRRHPIILLAMVVAITALVVMVAVAVGVAATAAAVAVAMVVPVAVEMAVVAVAVVIRRV